MSWESGSHDTATKPGSRIDGTRASMLARMRALRQHHAFGVAGAARRELDQLEAAAPVLGGPAGTRAAEIAERPDGDGAAPPTRRGGQCPGRARVGIDQQRGQALLGADALDEPPIVVRTGAARWGRQRAQPDAREHGADQQRQRIPRRGEHGPDRSAGEIAVGQAVRGPLGGAEQFGARLRPPVGQQVQRQPGQPRRHRIGQLVAETRRRRRIGAAPVATARPGQVGGSGAHARWVFGAHTV